MVRVIHLTVLLIAIISYSANAQQFIGIQSSTYTAIQNMPYNPAWVNNSANGIEVNALSISTLFGTNAYLFNKEWVLSSDFPTKGSSSSDYTKDHNKGKKHIWGNVDIMGPAVSFQYKKEHHIGLYSRMRLLVRGGGVENTNFQLLGKTDLNDITQETIDINNSGFSIHAFSEIGVTYGRVLRNDYYNIVKAGITIKYLMGIAAGSIYIDEFKFVEYPSESLDTLGQLNGQITAKYSYNIDKYIEGDAMNNPSEWFNRAGKGSLGFDIGVQYEYHPNGNPNYETPYLFSIAASITDIGGVRYYADTGSAVYRANFQSVSVDDYTKKNTELFSTYFNRLVQDTLLSKSDESEKFGVGLPTAFRLNMDWNAEKNFNLNVNMLLNLKGNNGTIYKPAYVSYINFTPTYGGNKFKVGIPFTFIGYQTMSIGTSIIAGPLYIGSGSIVSSLISKRIRNFDLYAGLTLKL